MRDVRVVYPEEPRAYDVRDDDVDRVVATTDDEHGDADERRAPREPVQRTPATRRVLSNEECADDEYDGVSGVDVVAA